jgi:hypothetical protein
MNALGRFICLIGSMELASLACAQNPPPQNAPPSRESRVLFLHHSTGECIWNGGVPEWFEAYNAEHRTSYRVEERNFPKESPYGWENFPYDFWNIWVQHAGPRPYREEPTLEMLTPQYQVIVFKHCFPVSNIEPDLGQGDVASAEKRLENYTLQYVALKEKLRQFPSTRFLLWTGAAQVRGDVDEASARRAQQFFQWVRNEWDVPGDNIFLWDFYALETERGLYLKPNYASGDAHPNEVFSRRVAPLLCGRIVDVIEGRGDTASITGGDAAAVAPKPETAPPEEVTAVAKPAEAPAASDRDWVFDNAEDAAQASRLWGKGARYVQDEGRNVVRLDFANGEEEDWGEYGPHRLVFSRPPATNYDVSPYGYLAFRVKSDQQMDLVVSLVTLPKPQGDRYQPHFAFSDM